VHKRLRTSVAVRKYFAREKTADTRTLSPGVASLMDQTNQIDSAGGLSDFVMEKGGMRFTERYAKIQAWYNGNAPVSSPDYEGSIDLRNL
jgi:hypothetical protein